MREKIIDFIKFHREVSIKVAVLICILLFSLYLIIGKEQPPEIILDDANPTLEQTVTEEAVEKLPEKIFVHIAGEVMNPGVFPMETGMRVYEAIELAGGAKKDADLTLINMASKVQDEEKIYVPKEGEFPDSIPVIGGSSISDTQGTSGKLVNLNTADSNQLQELTGVGPSTADKIIQYRQDQGAFKRIEDIMNVSGIGEKTFAKFKDKICI